MQEIKEVDYSSEEVKDVLENLKSTKKGLSHDEAGERLREDGLNVISEKKKYNVFTQFLSHLKSPLIIILLIAAVISFFTDQVTQGVIIVCIIMLGTFLDFFQEYSANKALRKLVESVATTAMVLRNGEKKEILIKYLVKGDVVLLSSGDMIPADARVLESQDFFVNQSSITGESFPVEKTADKLEEAKSVIDLNNILFSNTNVVSGSATAVIIKTGKNTEFGKIASKISEAPVKTEFEKGTANFGFLLMKIALVLVLFIFLVTSFIRQDFFESFMFAIAIAVGITPDLLPMIMAVTMSVGSKKMSKKGVIVKKLSAIPDFGSMNILCTDKTGTLTENKIAVVKYQNIEGKEEERVLRLTYINSTFQTGIKNPLDEAVINYKKIDIKGVRKLEEIPYDFTRKRMSVVVKSGKQNLMITKGAPEEIFECCTSYNKFGRPSKFDKRAMKRATDLYKSLSKDGFRVLAVSSKSVGSKKGKYTHAEETGMVFEGFISFFDPPKKDVAETIKQIHDLGIEVKIITGDNELVTQKISREVGLEIKGILLGKEIEEMSDDALRIKAQNTTIFARCSPDEKIRIIHALRENKNVIGYLGDGINDAPSIKNADVGISVNNAVDVAKESGDIILTRKSLSDLKEGVIEGRKIFGNTMKYIMMALSSNFGNMFSASGAVLFLPFLPMLPIQILLNNLIYDASQVTIPSDKVDNDWVSSPKKWDIKFLKKFMYVFGPLSSVFDFITFGVFYFVLKVTAPVFQTGWFIESLATQTLVIHIIRTKKTPILKSRASKLLVLTSLLGLGVGITIPYTPLGKLFGFSPLPLYFLGIILGITLVYLVLVEITKRIFYKRVSF